VRSDRLVLTLVALLNGCGASLTSSAGEAGSSADESLPSVPIELSIHIPGDGFVEIGELRGRAGLIFFFSTFDGISQAMLTPLALVVEARPECFFVGVAVQPDARTLVDAWAHALDPPFPVGWEPRDTLTSEHSPVGPIETVPTVVSVDARGMLVEKVHGLLQARELDDLLTRAMARGGDGTGKGSKAGTP
jgi:hypothetical protein